MPLSLVWPSFLQTGAWALPLGQALGAAGMSAPATSPPKPQAPHLQDGGGDHSPPQSLVSGPRVPAVNYVGSGLLLPPPPGGP